MPNKQTLEELLLELRRIEAHRSKGAEIKIKKVYQQILKELRHFLADEYVKYSEEDVLNYALLQKNAEYANFMEVVNEKLDNITPQMSTIITSTVKETYKNSYDGMVKVISKAITNEELKERLKALSSCTPEILKRAVENPIAGLTLKDTLEKNRKNIIYDIKQQIGIGLINGDRYPTMAKRVQESLDKDYKKSIRIVRTETHRVIEAGLHDGAEISNKELKENNSKLIEVKIWRTAKDSRVRHTSTADHTKMEGQTLQIEEEFDLGAGVKAKCPGNSGSAKNDIHCRCFLQYKLVDNPDYIEVEEKKKVYKDYKDVNSIPDIYFNYEATDVEKEVIQRYTGYLATNVNGCLRTNNKRKMEEFEQRIHILDNFLVDKILPEDVILKRGTCLGFYEDFEGIKKKDDIKNLDLSKLIGKEFIDKGFCSTSIIAPLTGGRDTVMLINAPKGFKGAAYIKSLATQKYKYQQEVLLKRGCKFKISSAIIKENKLYLEVDLIG